MIKRINSYFSKQRRLAILNAILVLIAIAANFYWQVFCNPSGWAVAVLLLCFLNTIFYPLISRFRKLHISIGFLNGVSFSLFIYCMLFLSFMNIYGIFMILVGLGLVIFIPHFFAVQIFWQSVVRPISKTIRYSFLTGVLSCVLGTLFIGYKYSEALTEFKSTESSNYEDLSHNFMNEKILGMHFIYHTKFCEYDGWRPPIHEPFLVLGMWMNGGVDPLDMFLEERVELYKFHYPENQTKFDCSCAYSYSSDYHESGLFE
jgi:hypothetical protein